MILKIPWITIGSLAALAWGLIYYNQSTRLADLKSGVTSLEQKVVGQSSYSGPRYKSGAVNYGALIDRLEEMTNKRDDDADEELSFNTLVVSQIEGLTESQIEILMGQLKEARDEGRNVDFVYSILLNAVAKVIPEWVLENVNGTLERSFMDPAIIGLAQRDSLAALRWLKDNREDLKDPKSWDGGRYERLVWKASLSIFDDDMQVSLEMFAILPEEKDHDSQYSSAYTEIEQSLWLLLDEKEERGTVAALVAKQKIQPLRHVLMRATFQNVVYNGNFEEANALIQKLAAVDDSEVSHAAGQAVGQSFENVSKEKGQKMMDWFVSKFQNDPDYFAAYETMEVWARVAPENAADWLQKQEPGKMKDRVSLAYLQVALRMRPHEALQWAEEMTDEGMRESARHSALSRWQDNDPDAYAEWRARQ